MDVPACNYDGGDCADFVEYYSDCIVPEPDKVGDGICDGGAYWTEECGMDGGDCNGCDAPYIAWIGDSVCDGGDYLTVACGMDGGDCATCIEQISGTGIDPSRIGDGACDEALNNTACGYDGNDCLADPKAPPCIVDNPIWLGDGFCDGGMYNTPQCGYDGGDCLVCNAAVPDISKIGKTIMICFLFEHTPYNVRNLTLVLLLS